MSKNIYSEPEYFGLEQVAEIEYSSGSYEFDTRVVWKVKGAFIFYTARDSGCSCPTPFERLTMANIDRLDFNTLKREVMYELSGGEYNRLPYISPTQAQEFLKKVKDMAAVK